jgi:uncharacterized repeat protein (TIGR03806 family)
MPVRISAESIIDRPEKCYGISLVSGKFHIAAAFSIMISTALGLTQRVANTTIAMPQLPPPATTNSYGVPNAFGTLTFAGPMLTAFPPGETNRLFVAERGGTIQVITNLAAPTKTTFLDISSRVNTASEGGLLGMAFHPGYATNRRFFLFYTLTATNQSGTGFHTRVSEFMTSATNANYASPTTEIVLFSQYNEAANHNAGDIAFGPDGYLYIATGDEGGGNDSYNNSQRIDRDFFSAILRIDVDKRPGSLAPNRHPAINAPTTNYAIPPDNPFIGATQFNGSPVVSTNVRTEFWAVGLRNPFRMSFDEVTGELYAADVGQNAREEVNLIRRGGNYGWKWREGKIATPGIGTPPPGFTNWIDPLLDYTRGTATNQGTSVTGGRVYRGDLLPELVGRYIFADYISGHIWAMTHDVTNATSFAYLATDSGIVHFGRDPRNGDLLLCDLTGNVVRRLVVTNAPSGVVPTRLSGVGAFADLATLDTNPGVVPYDVNLPFWSDGARKSRWFCLPSTNLTITFAPDSPWVSPTSAVWIKHFEIETTSGVPASARRLETRVLVKTASGGYGVTYRWGFSKTNAVLVPHEGLSEPIVINDGGTIRTQIWRYPSRAECLQCHRGEAGFAVGFNTPQLNRDYAYGPNDLTNQISRLSEVGYFHTHVPSVNSLRALAHPTNEAISVEYRARSYLEANCANCHFPGGAVPAAFDARIVTPISSTHLINGAPANNFGDPNNVIVRPGAISNSLLHARMATRGAAQMPPIASSVVDTQGVALIAAWINSLAGYQTFAEWQLSQFGTNTGAGVGADEDFDGDGAVNYFEYLTGTEPTNAASIWSSLGFSETKGPPRIRFERLANRGFQVQATTDLVHGAWAPVDVPENRPLFGATSQWVEVFDPAAMNDGTRHYRVGVFEP